MTLCMAITVLLVRILNPDGVSNSNTMRLATAYYDEKVRMLRCASLGRDLEDTVFLDHSFLPQTTGPLG